MDDVRKSSYELGLEKIQAMGSRPLGKPDRVLGLEPVRVTPLSGGEAQRGGLSALFDAGSTPVEQPKAASAPQGETEGSLAGDLWKAYGVGSNALLKMAGDFYGLVTGDMDNAVSQAGRSGMEYWQGKKSVELLGAEQRRKMAVDREEGELGKAWAFIKETMTDPRLLAATVTEQVPNFVGAGAGGVAVKGATGAALARGATTEAAKQAAANTALKAGVAGAVGTGAVMQGADVGGDQYAEALKMLGAMPADTAAALPQIRELLDKGATLPEAKTALALVMARETGALAGAISVGAQLLPGAREIEKALVGQASKAPFGKGVAAKGAGALVGGVGESASETAEEVGGQMAKNAVATQVDPERPLMQGTGEAAGQAIVGAGPLGAAAGALNARADGPAPAPAPAPAGGAPAGGSAVDRFLNPNDVPAVTRSGRTVDQGAPVGDGDYRAPRQPGEAVDDPAVLTGEAAATDPSTDDYVPRNRGGEPPLTGEVLDPERPALPAPPAQLGYDPRVGDPGESRIAVGPDGQARPMSREEVRDAQLRASTTVEMNPRDGQPYFLEGAARRHARRVGGEAIQVEGGYAVRRPNPPSGATDTAPTTAAPEPAAEQTAGIGEGAAPAPKPATVDDGAHEAAASPKNDLTPPSKEQILGGSAQLGHSQINGLHFTTETPEGADRVDLQNDPPKWKVRMKKAHYGYFRGTEDTTGEHVDAYVKPGTGTDFDGTVYVIDQIDPKSKKFDEPKVMVGYRDQGEAESVYDAHFNDDSGPKRRGAITAMSWADFKQKVRAGTMGATAYKEPAAPSLQGVPVISTVEQLNKYKEKYGRSQQQEDGTTVFFDDDGKPVAKTLVPVTKLAEKPAGTPPIADQIKSQQPKSPETRIHQAKQEINRLRDVAHAMAMDRWSQEFPYDARSSKAAKNRFKAIREEEVAKRQGQIDKLEREIADAQRVGKPQPTQTPKSPAAEIKALNEKEAMDKAKADAAKALDDLANLLGAKKNMLPEQRRKLLPILSELMDALLRMGYLKFKAAAREAMRMIREKLGADAAEQISLTDLRAAYNVAAQGYQGVDAEADVNATTSLEDQPAKKAGDDRAFVDAVMQRFREGKGFASIVDARKLFEETTGKKAEGVDQKRADELVEQAIVSRAREIAASNERDKYGAMVALYGLQPKLATRTSTSVENQAYSTPAPLAFVASRLAGIFTDSQVYEPTAGNGMLLMEAGTKPGTNRALANELDPDRAKFLDSLGFRVRNGDALDFNPRGNGVAGSGAQVVIANPPFGHVKTDSGADRGFLLDVPGGRAVQTPEIDHAIAWKALEAMSDNGDAVLILGGINKQVRDPKARADAYQSSSAKRSFFYYLYQNYNVADHFTVAGELYERQGAGWPVDVIVIKGRGKSARRLPSVEAPRIYDSWASLGELIGANRVDAPGGEPGTRGSGGDSTRPGPGSDGNRVPGPAGDSGAAAGGSVPGPAAGGGRSGGGVRGGGPAGTGNASGGQGSGGGAGVQSPGNAGTAGSPRPAAGPSVQGGAQQPSGGNGDAAGPGGAAGATAGDARGAADAVRPDETGTNANQQTYTPKSGSKAIGTLVPTNMKAAIEAALASLAERVGDIDQFVMRELGYRNLGELGDALAAEQIDAIALALESFSKESGFIIGDQTGIGKGRVVAGLIRWALKNGKTPMFVTEKPGLYADIVRDLKDVGVTDIRPVLTNTSEKVPLDDGGMLRSGGNQRDVLKKLAEGGRLDPEYNMIFTTYSQMQMVKKERTTRHDFLEAYGRGAVLILDETHNAGGQNAGRKNRREQEDDGSAKEGRALFARQLVGGASAVLYSSATYAKRPDVMDLYFKTDMSIAVGGDANRLPAAIEAGGVPLQQVVAAMLTKAGQYVRRERSFNGVEYHTDTVEVDKPAAENISASLAQIAAFDHYKKAAVAALDDEIRSSGEAIGVDNATGAGGATSTNFTAIMHNIVNQMLLSLKVKQTIGYAVDALKRGERPVITLANTMGSFIERYVEDMNLQVGDAVALSFRDVLLRYLERTRDVIIKDPDGRKRRERLTDDQLGPKGVAKFEAVKKFIREAPGLDNMPISPIDYLHAELRKAGYKTGEITGRQHVINYSARQGAAYETRRDSEINTAGRREIIKRFNSGDIDVVILNQAGSTGLSLHASEKFKDQRQRHMIILQPELNIDTHMQMLGRVHRTGQVRVPRYTQLVSDIPAEKRPAAVLSKKMASLNANTTANKRSAFRSETIVDFMNQYGDEVAASLMEDMPEIHRKLDEPLKPDKDQLSRDNAIAKITGRLPLLTIAEQEEIYRLLEDGYTDLLAQKDALGENALEAKTLELDARTVRSDVMFEGEGESPFAAGAYAETVDVKRLGKPYTSAEVLQIVADNLRAADLNLDAALEGASLDDMEEYGTEIMAGVIRQVRDDFRVYKAGELEGMEDPDKIKALETKLDGALARWMTLADEIHIGAPYRLTLADGSNVMAVATNITRKKGVKMPVAAGAWVVDFALADASRHVKIPFSKLEAPGEDRLGSIAYEWKNRDPITGEPVLKGFDSGQRVVREQRVMMTGNLLAAFGRLPRGQIVNYTDSSGTVRQGILMRRGYEIKDAAKDLPVLLTADQTMAFFRRLQELKRTAQLETEDGALVLFYLQGTGEIQLRAKMAKSEGGKYYLDRALRALTGDWVSRGNSMRVEIAARDARAVINRISEIGQIVANQNKDVANAVGGNAFKAGAPPAQPKAAESREPAPPRAGLVVSEIKKRVDAFVNRFPGAARLRFLVVQSVADIPERHRPSPYASGVWYQQGDVVALVADNLASAERLEQVLLHEIVGHYGVTAILGDRAQATFDQVLQIARAKGQVTGRERPGDANFATVESVRALYGDISPTEVAEEVLARIAETNSKPTFLEMLYAKMRQALRALGVDLKLTNADLKQLVMDAARRLRDGHTPPPGVGRTAAAAASRESREPTIRDQLRAAEGVVSQARGMRERAMGFVRRVEGVFEPLMTLPQRDEFLKTRYLVLGKLAEAEEMSTGIGKVFADATPEQSQQAFDYLTTADAEASSIADRQIREKAVWIKGEINRVGDALVARGLLAEEQRETYRDAYLPRLYLKHFLSQQDWLALGAGKKPSNMGYLKQRKDIPEEVRKIILGEIADPGFLSAHAIAKPLRDMALLDWLEQISKNDQWVLPASFVQWNGRRVSARWLASEAARIRVQSDLYTEENAQRARALADEMEQTARRALDGISGDAVVDYRQIPDTPRYGRMRGVWVRKEIYDDLMGVHDFMPAETTVIGSIFGYGGIGTKVTAWWKMGKVALNVPSQVRNFVSNAIMLQLSGVPLVRIPDLFVRAVAQLTSNGEFYQIAKKYGVTEVTFQSQELARINRELLDIQRKMGTLGPIGRIKLMAEPITRFAGHAYQTMEALFKTAKLMDAMQRQGMDEATAALEAHRWMLDYSLVSKEVRYARNAPIGMPFMTYTAKILPLLLDVAINHPQRYLPWVGMFYSLPYLFSMMTGVDDDDLDKLHLSLPKWMRERGHIVVLPWKDGDGRWQVVDLGYFMPWSFYTDMVPASMRTARRTFEGDMDAARQSLGDDWSTTNAVAKLAGLVGGPIPDLMVALKTNKDPFTGREIIPAGASREQKTLYFFNYVWDLMLPPMISSRGFVSPMGAFDPQLGGKAVQAARGDTNRFGEPRSTGAQAGLYMAGVNLYGVDAQNARTGNIMQLRREIEDAQRLMVNELRNRGLSDEERKRIVDKHREEIADRIRKLQEYAQRSRMPVTQ